MNSKKGFTLLEILIALSIVSILALLLSTLLTTSFQGVSSIERQLVMTDFTSDIQQVINHADLCNAAFKGQSLVLNSHPNLSMDGAIYNDTTGNYYPNTASPKKILISSLYFSQVVKPVAPATSVQAVLTLSTDISGGNSGMVILGGAGRLATFHITFQVSGTTIVACSGAASMGFTTPILPENNKGDSGKGSNPKATDQCGFFYKDGAAKGTWIAAPGGNIGAGRSCIAFITHFADSYRYQGGGCYYDATSGQIYACSDDNNLTCGYFCAD